LQSENNLHMACHEFFQYHREWETFYFITIFLDRYT
jgi:hypothetical protein